MYKNQLVRFGVGLIGMMVAFASCSPGDSQSGLTPTPGNCPGAIEPSEPFAPIVMVGNGSPDSCTESALQAAVRQVSERGTGTVMFDCGENHIITLTESLLVASANDRTIMVDGENRITISGGNVTRIFDLAHHTNFIVQRLALTDGRVSPETEGNPLNSGAAIRHPWYGTLYAIDVVFENNICESMDGEIGGGAVYAGGLSQAVFAECTFRENSASNGGGILNRGSTLIILDTEFIDNAALSVGTGQFGNGGGLYIDGMDYETVGDFLMCRTRFEGNSATQHGSGAFAYFYSGTRSTISDCEFTKNGFAISEMGSGTLYHEGAPLWLANTTFSYNQPAQHAAGLFLGGNSDAQLTNCTFAHNRAAGNGAGIFTGSSQATLVHCTFMGNDADYGPAIFKGQSASVFLKSSIFDRNTTSNEFSATSCHESFINRGGNIQWPQIKNNGNPDTPCVEGVLFADPLLNGLSENGGFAQSAAPMENSPAINGASDCPEFDQTGKNRSEPCDVGAVEI